MSTSEIRIEILNVTNLQGTKCFFRAARAEDGKLLYITDHYPTKEETENAELRWYLSDVRKCKKCFPIPAINV